VKTTTRDLVQYDATYESQSDTIDLVMSPMRSEISVINSVVLDQLKGRRPEIGDRHLSSHRSKVTAGKLSRPHNVDRGIV